MGTGEEEEWVKSTVNGWGCRIVDVKWQGVSEDREQLNTRGELVSLVQAF